MQFIVIYISAFLFFFLTTTKHVNIHGYRDQVVHPTRKTGETIF